MFTVLQKPDGIQQKRLVLNRAKRTLVDTGAATDAQVFLDDGEVMLTHVDRFYLARIFAWAFMVCNGTVGASGSTFATTYTFGRIDVGMPVIIQRDCAFRADSHTAMGDATAAIASDLITTDRALVTSDADDLHNVWILGVTPHGQFDTLAYDSTLLVDTAAHGRLGTRGKLFGDIDIAIGKPALICMTSHFLKHLIFEFLDIGIK